LFWVVFTACIDASPDLDDDPAISRVIVQWDPLACGPPHRIVVELENEEGLRRSASTPCNTGSLTIDAPHYGLYYGRIYAWEAGEDIRSIIPVRLVVDAAVVRWLIATPP
jgi:hypothetical protein